MKIRLSEDGVRFRIVRAELDKLLSGRAISLEVSLPRDHVYRANVGPSALGQWQLATDPTGLWLTIPIAELQSLSESLPKREGLEHRFELTNGGTARVMFEVDTKDKEGRRSAVRGAGTE